MTGYLITGSLLRERDRSEEKGQAMEEGGAQELSDPARTADPRALLCGAGAGVVWCGRRISWRAPWWYVLHVSNIHMATLPAWPPGTNHFWSLAMQQQFYLVWPFVIWFTPRKWLWPAILAFAAVGPVTRLFTSSSTVVGAAGRAHLGVPGLFRHRRAFRAGGASRDVAGKPGPALDFHFRAWPATSRFSEPTLAGLANLRVSARSSRHFSRLRSADSSRRGSWDFADCRPPGWSIRRCNGSGKSPMASICS